MMFYTSIVVCQTLFLECCRAASRASRAAGPRGANLCPRVDLVRRTGKVGARLAAPDCRSLRSLQVRAVATERHLPISGEIGLGDGNYSCLRGEMWRFSVTKMHHDARPRSETNGLGISPLPRKHADCSQCAHHAVAMSQQAVRPDARCSSWGECGSVLLVCGVGRRGAVPGEWNMYCVFWRPPTSASSSRRSSAKRRRAWP